MKTEKSGKQLAGGRIIVIALLFAAVLSSAAFSLGKTVQLNLAFSIGVKDDNLTVGNTFVSAQDSNVTLSVISDGTTISAGNVTAYSSTAYMLQVTQSTGNNRFIIAFTNATNQTIINKLGTIGGRKIPSKAFGDLAVKIPESFMNFLRLEYDDVNIISRTRWSANPVNLLISNEGADDRGVTQISIGLVK